MFNLAELIKRILTYHPTRFQFIIFVFLAIGNLLLCRLVIALVTKSDDASE